MEFFEYIWREGTTTDLFIFLLGLGVAAVVVFNFLALRRLQNKYHQLDKLNLMLAHEINWLKILIGLPDGSLVKIHRNGDYEITHPLNKGEQN